LHEQEASTAAFLRLKALNSNTYSEQDIENLDHLDFGAGFSPYLRGPYTTMYVRRPGPFVNMLDFQQPKKVMLFIDVILLAGLSIAFDLPTHRGYDSRTRSG
jgi:methylmalonyl-CoA mutase